MAQVRGENGGGRRIEVGRGSGPGRGGGGRGDDFDRRRRCREENGREDERRGLASDREGRAGKRSEVREREFSRSRSKSRERERERERERVGKGGEDVERRGERRRRAEEEYNLERDEKRRRYRELDSREYHGGREKGGREQRERPWIGRRGEYEPGPRVESRERFAAFLSRDRERERERDRDRERDRERERSRGGKEREKEVVMEKVAMLGQLIGQHEEKEGEEKARTYQLEVLAQAKVKNTIAFLETGAGKTLIAVLLMREKHKVLREQGKRMLAVFLVPKVPLVYQQAEVIRNSTNFNVGHYCGEMGQDFWDARRWQREFDTKDVFVMTAQILLNILRHSIVRMEAIHLLVLDECHHAVKKHPYSLVMSEFYHIAPKDKRPCVFGMTASPVNLKGVSNQEDCAIKIRNLESKLDSIVCTIKDRKELEKYVPMPSETMVIYDKPALLFSLREEIKQMETTVEEAANASARRSKWRFMGARDAGAKEELRLVYGVAERTESDGAASLAQKLRAIIYALDELGQWCAYKVALTYLTSLRNDERIQNHQLDVKFQEKYLEKVCGLLRCNLREGAVGSKDPAENGESADVEGDKVQDPMDVEEGELPDSQVVSVGEHVDEILGAAVADGKVTPKVQSLIKILLGYQHTDDFRAIIFVERVVAAQILPKVFAELPSLKFVKCASLIGHNNNQDMRTRQMQETISKFRDGRVTLLVATSVAEEGLDIRQCNVVIRFDLAKTVLAYIQSRGRARKPGSDYILMLERGNLQHEAFLRNAKSSEETLRKEAIERTDLGEKRESAILASIDVGEGEIYQVPATGAVVSMNSAVGLVHFYCSQLPSDRYSILRPEFIMNKHEGPGGVKYSCKLQLPCNAPLETVEGPECNSIRGAQQTVCLEACKKLHEMGAFTDMLLPDKGSGEEAAKLEGSEEGEPLPGTSRHREYYPEGIADILRGDWIVADKDPDAKQGSKVLVFMYNVKCENVGVSKDSLLTETSDFAILVGQELQDEVLTMQMDLFVARTMTTRASLEFCGALDLSLLECIQRVLDTPRQNSSRNTTAPRDLDDSAQSFCTLLAATHGFHLAKLKSFHVRLMSIVLDVNVEPATTPWDPVKAYLFVPVVHKVASDPIEMVDWDLVKRTIEMDAWNNPLQRARPDVYLGTDERALGGDRREYGFGKLRYGLAFGQRAHPTYGIRGAVAQFDVVKATGLLPAQDTVEKTIVQEVPPEGKLLMADGFVEVEGLVGRIVTAVHSGKRFYVDWVRLDMTADSSFPQKDGYLGPLEYTSYADYYKQKYGVELVCKKQPLLRGRGVSHCKNLLSPRFETSDGGALDSQDALDKTYYVMLPPELCLVHPLPGPLVRGAQRLPSVMRRVESMLLAIQLKHRINYPIAASKVLEALTAASCQETFSYERAELLGDAYLKWVVSRRLFLKFPNKHEGQLTRMRQQTVSNSVLYQYALEKGLQSYIQADRFAPSRWAAPGVPPVFDEDTKDGDDSDKEMKSAVPGEVVEIVGEEGEIVVQEISNDLANMEDGEIEGDSSAYRVLSSKTLADVVEAFIGIYYVEGGQDAATHLMNWIGIPVEFDEEDGRLAISGCQVPETVMRSIDFTALEASIGHKFRERSLLVEAITHASRPSSGVPCYQRLEFVGDAVLDHLITRFLFFKYTDLPPGRLTDLRAAAVNNENFARVAVKHSFHLHLRHGSSALDTQIRNFVNDIQTELDKPGVNSFGLGDFKAPKVLGDILESIAGALFLDTCLDVDQVWNVFEPLVHPMVTPETLPMHPVRELQERCQQQAEGLEYKASRAGNVATVEVFIDGVQIGSAQNAQKKMAQKLAARNALVVLKEKEVIKEKAAKEAENGDANSGKANKNGNTNFTRQTLNDLCLKRHWPMPQYRSVLEGGPAHAKRFTYSVRVLTTTDGWTEECFGEPMPSVKKAKDSAALILLALLRRSN